MELQMVVDTMRGDVVRLQEYGGSGHAIASRIVRVTCVAGNEDRLEISVPPEHAPNIGDIWTISISRL